MNAKKVALSAFRNSKSCLIIPISKCRIPYMLGRSECRIENVVVLGEVPSELSLTLNRVFTLEKKRDCFIFHMDEFRKTALTHRPLFGNDYPAPLRGSDGPVFTFLVIFNSKDTFTYITMKRRIPDIIYQIINSQPLPSSVAEAYRTLANTIRDNGPILDITNSDSLLSELFRIQIRRAIHDHLHWHTISWWLAENYEFMLLNHIQHTDKSLPEDPFFALKSKALTIVAEQIESFFPPLIEKLRSETGISEDVFISSLLTLLWGNQADLSMSNGVVEKKSSLDALSSNKILVNDSDLAWKFLQTHDMREITVFSDNSGLEMLCDFLFITLLLVAFPHCIVHYVIKASPVFVSDVTLDDIRPGLDLLRHSHASCSIGRGSMTCSAALDAGEA